MENPILNLWYSQIIWKQPNAFRFRLSVQIHAGARLPDIQRPVDHRSIQRLCERNAVLDGNLSGGVFRRRIHHPFVVSRLPFQVHGLLRPATLHTKTDMHHRYVRGGFGWLVHVVDCVSPSVRLSDGMPLCVWVWVAVYDYAGKRIRPIIACTDGNNYNLIRSLSTTSRSGRRCAQSFQRMGWYCGPFTFRLVMWYQCDRSIRGMFERQFILFVGQLFHMRVIITFEVISRRNWFARALSNVCICVNVFDE